MNDFVKRLRRRLFWDVDPEAIDENIHRRFVIERVLQRGGLEDLRLTIHHYGMPLFSAEARQIRSLDPVTLAFAACVCNEKEENFRCCTTRR